jgi:hypothetical protein
MKRHDLLALTDDSLAALTNRGLVRRARAEIEAGQGPRLEEAEDGTVTGRFPDGTVATLAPGVPIREAPCSCGATNACRHRVAVALAYRRWHESASSDLVVSSVSWSPADVDDAALRAHVGTRTLERAKQLRRLGCDVEVSQGREGRAPEARLPTCTVRFLVPGDLAYARCDCRAEQQCEHIPLAVWAFREARDRSHEHGDIAVHLLPAASDPISVDPLAAALAFSREVLVQGVVHLSPAVASRLAIVRADLDRAGMTWPGTILDDVEDLLEAYRTRSARYGPSPVARLLGEMAARVAATRGTGALPARFVLGMGESRETELGHLRLVSLGARVEGGENERWTTIYLADPDAGVVLVQRKGWTYPNEASQEPEDGPQLAARTVIAGVTLGTLATGQIVTRVGKRSANREFRLGSTRRGNVSVTPQAGEWDSLPDGILIRDLASHAAALKSRPPRWLRSRVLAESMHVVSIGQVLHVSYAPGAQTLVALVSDRSDVPLRLVLRHRTVAPHAIDALAAMLSSSAVRPQFVSGSLYVGPHGLEMIPVAIVTDRVVVLDLAPATDAKVALGRVGLDESVLSTALDEAWSCLADAAHMGLARLTPVWHERIGQSAQRAERIGLATVGTRLADLSRQVREAASGSPEDPAMAAAAAAWEHAAIRLALTQEQAAGAA